MSRQLERFLGRGSLVVGAALMFVAIMISILVISPDQATAYGPGITINEIRIDQPSDDNDEFFELEGPVGSDLSDLSYLVIGDGATGNGTIEEVTALSGLSIGSSGYFVASEATFTIGSSDVVTDLNFENSDNVTHLLVRDFTGADAGDLDTDDDGTLDVMPWSEVVDCVALLEEVGAGEATYCDTTVGPDGTFVPGYVFECPSNWIIGDFGDPSSGTPGSANLCTGVSITKTGPDTIIAGETITYHLAIGNTSTQTATNVVLTDTLPVSTTLVSDNIGSSTEVSPGVYVWQLSDLATGEIRDYQLQVEVTVAVQTGTILTNTAMISTDTADDNLLDNQATAVATVVPSFGACGESATLISAIQGGGATSPLEGQIGVVIEGIVVADVQGGDGDLFGTDLGGFYVQEEAADYDNDDTTSEGIFVYGPGAADVEVGDVVRLAGEVDEYVTSSGASSMTQLRLSSDIIACSTATVPDPVNLVLPVESLDVFEQHEGMLVTFAQQLVITEYFNFDRYNEVVVSEPIAADRPFQPTAYIDPDSDETAITDTLDLIARSRILIDDARSVQNPALLRHPNGDVFDLNNRFRGGDTVQDVTGVLDETFGRYRLQPTVGATYTAQNLRPEAPEAVGGTLQVAAFNVLNYFLTVDDGPDVCGPDLDMDCRGADSEEEFQRQRAKILAALEAIGADVFGLIEMENTTGVEPLADLVTGLNDVLGPDTYAYIDTGVVGTDAIRQGIIYRPDTVTPVGDYAVLDDAAFTNPLDYATPKSRPAVVQTFRNNATGEIFTVVVNHLKSKGSECGEGDDDPYQGNCNLTRTMAADYLMDWLATDPTNSGVDNNLIIGDLNAYDKEDPIDEIVEGPDDILGTADDYVDLLLQFEGEFAYTYVFDGQLGYLDYALANLNLLPRVTGADVWHINADEPDILDYDTSFKPPEQDALYEPNAYRASDHDPVIVGLFPEAAALALNKEAHAATVAGGDSITYTLTVASSGLLTATNVVLTDTLPAGATYQMANTTDGTCQMVGGDLVCMLGDLEPGEQAVVTLVVGTPLESLTLANVAVVSTDADELDLTDNTAEVSVVVTRYFIYLPLMLNEAELTR